MASMSKRDVRARRLAEIRERHEASTPDGFPMIADSMQSQDASFIAHAHRDIPWLLDEIERLEGCLEDARYEMMGEDL